jgi:methylmalonyl-CoA mutase cobalamin-binding subunit
MLFVLKKMGPVQFQRQFGAGTLDPAWPRGRKPVQLTDMFAKTYAASEAILKDLPRPTEQRALKVALGATDVHEHALFIIERALQAMGLTPVMLGSELNPVDIVQRAQEQAVDLIIVSTYNGMALEVGKALRRELDRLRLQIPVYMGGRLNQGVEGQALPVDVTADLEGLGLIPCQTIPELLQQVGQGKQ